MHSEEDITAIQNIVEELPGHPAEFDLDHPDNQPVADGDGVFFTFINRHNELVSRPAVVVNNWQRRYGTKIQLAVFVDGSNDLPDAGLDRYPVVWRTSVEYSREPKPDTWHR